MLGILNGCIPIKEIQDEDIKSLLDGFDLSIILNKKNNDYMEFKNEIKEKFQIRKKLSFASEEVIDRFETWWDKYGISLSKIESEVISSSSKLNDVLKDLGYE